VSCIDGLVREKRASMATHFIVSDVHLGSLLAKTGEFQNFLSLPKDGDVLILLGDILDFGFQRTPTRSMSIPL
jgi:UDP-2,3-diacylglucosamine pyrophosphatase LpxH